MKLWDRLNQWLKLKPLTVPVGAFLPEVICFTPCLYFHAVKFISSISEPVLTPNIFTPWTHLETHQSPVQIWLIWGQTDWQTTGVICAGIQGSWWKRRPKQNEDRDRGHRQSTLPNRDHYSELEPLFSLLGDLHFESYWSGTVVVR